MKKWMRDHSDQIFIGSVLAILGLSIKGLISIVAPGKGKVKTDIPESIYKSLNIQLSLFSICDDIRL